LKNRGLKRIFEHKMEEVRGGYRKLHNEELQNLYSLQNIRVIKLRTMRWVHNVACMGQLRNSYRILVRKPEGKRPLGRPLHR
jgi:hypothetical protein